MKFKIADMIDKNIVINMAEALPESKREKLWKDCIAEAKMLLGDYKEIRFKIVELALKCCIIHKGGKSLETRYTVKAFARDLGIKSQTLFEWMRMRQVALALPVKDQKEATFAQIGAISRQFMRGVSVGDANFKEQIRSRYKDIKNQTQATIKMKKYLRHMKTIKFNVDHPRMIADCDPEVLTEILSVCRGIVYELAKRDKKPKYANVVNVSTREATA